MTKEEAKQLKPEENEVAMEELEKNARELILAITKKTLKTLKDNGLLKEPSSLQNLSFSSPEMRAFLEKIKTPKYDPCRLFKKGDKVKRRTVDGRTDQEISEGIELTVIYGEDKYGNVRVQNPNGICIVTKSVFLELVTPVEELEPYFVFEDATSWQVKKGNSLCARYGKATHPHAKEAAEAERDRLNAEYRKDENNG